MQLNALGVSNLQHSAILLNGITENVITTFKKNSLIGQLRHVSFALNTIIPQI